MAPGFTHHPYGMSSFGCPLPSKDIFPLNGQQHYFVRGVGSGIDQGLNYNDGLSPNTPFLTMARAFAKVQSGGVIHFTGNIREQLDTPVGVFDVTIVGEGTRPRHADAHTGNNGYSGATWKAPAVPTATTPLLRVRQQGWRLVNFLCAPPTDDAGLEFMRDAAAGDAERDSSHSEVIGVRFAGGQDGILISGTEIVHNLKIAGCIFNDATGAAIKATSYYGRRFQIEWNEFENNADHIVAALGDSKIVNNIFGQFTDDSINLTGGNGHNVITKNYLSGTYSEAGGYFKSNANDEWAGNFNSLAGGITVVDPA